MKRLAGEDVLAPTHHGRRFLLIGGFLTAIASLLHLAIIWGGPPWYQFFGASLDLEGPYMQQLRGRMVFMVVSSAICIGLGLCYAIGAGALRSRSPSRF